MKVLLIGASGQLSTAFQENPHHHTLIPYSSSRLDICDKDEISRILDKEKPDYVINASAYTNVDGAETDIQTARAVNALGPKGLAQAANDRSLGLIHYSTDYVFNGRSKTPYVESSPTDPLSVYGKTKLEGENLILEANPRACVVRTSWLYHTTGKNFPKTMLSLGKKGTPLRVVDDQIGCPTFAPHLVEASWKLIEGNLKGLFHVVGSGETSWYGFACELFKQFGVNSNITPVATSEFPRPAPRPAFAVLRSERPETPKMPDWKVGVTDFWHAFRKSPVDA